MPSPIIILSPSKTLRSPVQASHLTSRPDSPWATLQGKPPFFQGDSHALRTSLAALSPGALMEYFHISQSLAETVRANLAQEQPLPAWTLYAGEAFKTLDLPTLSPGAARLASQSLGILSALYGYLGPTDRILPYRLDLTLPPPPGSPLEKQSQSLRSFWQPRITQHLNDLVVQTRSPLVISLASQEFHSLINPRGLSVPLLQIDFLQAGGRKISARAKQARGLFARWYLQQAGDSGTEPAIPQTTHTPARPGGTRDARVAPGQSEQSEQSGAPVPQGLPEILDLILAFRETGYQPLQVRSLPGQQTHPTHQPGQNCPSSLACTSGNQNRPGTTGQDSSRTGGPRPRSRVADNSIPAGPRTDDLSRLKAELLQGLQPGRESSLVFIQEEA